jgi:hypothetical protein
VIKSQCKKGQKVKVIGLGGGHEFPVDTICTVATLHHSNAILKGPGVGGLEESWHVMYEHFELVRRPKPVVIDEGMLL